MPQEKALRYHHLNVSQNQIRLLCFQDTPPHTATRLILSYVSLNDWKPEYISFRKRQTLVMSPAELCEAWKEQCIFGLATSQRDVPSKVARFKWGDYICLSYAEGDDEGRSSTIFVDGVAINVSNRLQAALRDAQSSYECRLGMRFWVDALCIDQSDTIDRGAHVLRVKDIFGQAFSLMAWTKQDADLHVLGLTPPGERLLLCETVLDQHGKQALEEILGLRERQWGEATEEDKQITTLLQDVDELVFDHYHYADSDDSDDFGLADLHFRDVVCIELMQMFRKEFWSRPWTIQELTVSCMTSTIHWGETVLRLSTLRTVADVFRTYSESDQVCSAELWNHVHPGLDLLRFESLWNKSEPTLCETDSLPNEALIQHLCLLAARVSCSQPHDRVYALLGLFPLSVSSVVSIDYSREVAELLEEFISVVPQWKWIET